MRDNGSIDGDEIIVCGRGKIIGTCKGLSSRFHRFFHDDGYFVWIKHNEFSYRFGVVILTGCDDAAVAYGFSDDLNLFAEMDRLEADNFGPFDVVTNAVAIIKRHPNDGVANGHFVFNLIRLLGCYKAREAERYKGKQHFFHDENGLKTVAKIQNISVL
jgi:hypothetical protein